MQVRFRGTLIADRKKAWETTECSPLCIDCYNYSPRPIACQGDAGQKCPDWAHRV